MNPVFSWLLSRGIVSPAVRSYMREIRYGFSRPEWWTRLEEDRRFFRRFVPHGGLVYDVGANVGEMTSLYRLIGARVIAFEPQANVFHQLAQRFAHDSLVVPINEALGRRSECLTMFLGSDHSTTSLSADYVSHVSARRALGGATWSAGPQIRLSTLDEMIIQFGRPDFVKIDVEGFEAEVLGGLSSAIAAVSFEITAEHIEPANECIDHLNSIGNYQYNWSGLWSNVLQCSTWLSPSEIRDLVSTWPQRQAHYPRKADVYARIVRMP